ncbi:uncharacterized protein NDAI_0F00630 [Naumovozyma dairenensis CBS 421]|uniref:RNA-directed DNA polymerase n=1 Tax=Naumovozyma dairenensis (strain ATCC 10597 / BCRC 20456 / CBS 421 / NBRC 0211 / NRRL Y-12639) TaxID=1071378 RepID=G0WC71_NAUDC|nr:hypothetical protein NDAI_0F00630 [Naumovozyma dairenensis CBS 421]CCD25382.1 hypothetical protein NDAI_0F00630 [Naumovozyma dairenensis CBS 421]
MSHEHQALINELPHVTTKLANKQKIQALLDTGASSNIIDPTWANRLNLTTRKLTKPIHCKTGDGTMSEITHACKVKFIIDGEPFTLSALIAPFTLTSAIILGMPFINNHPNILRSALKTMVQPSELVPWRTIRNDITNKNNEVTIYVRISTSDSSTEPPSEITKEFGDILVEKIPAHDEHTKTIHHQITLKEGATPVFQRAYRMAEEERKALEDELKDLMKDNKTSPSDSPFAAPVIYVKKKDGSRRLCVDYRRLNEITVKAKYPIPLIDDLFDQLRGATIFSKLDLVSGYHQVPIAEEDRYKTAFITQRGQYQWNVMPFGLTNAPATFQRLMNHVLRDYIGEFCIVYLDDILNYSKTNEEHIKHIRKIMEALRAHHLFAKKSKCSFFLHQVGFLGHVINATGIHSDPEKIECIKNWIAPKDNKSCQRFLGLIGYYRRFIKDFSTIAKPLREYANDKSKKIKWHEQQEFAFEKLKRALLEAPVLKPFDNNLDVVVTTDASDTAIGGTLELYKDGKFYGVVAYMSKALHGHELNWPIREKEFFAIVCCLEKWRHYLLGKKFKLYTDHQSLKYVLTERSFKLRLARWWDDLADYNFKIIHIKGKNNHVDALSRLNAIDTESTERTISRISLDPQHLTTLRKEYQKDPELSVIYSNLQKATPLPQKLVTIIKHYSIKDGLLYYSAKIPFDSRLVIPKGTIRQTLMHLHHDSLLAGHPGSFRTYQNLVHDYYWPNMVSIIEQYTKTCPQCQRTKHARVLPSGIFQPLAVPYRPWSSIGIDFVSGMKEVHKFNSVLVVIDRLTKMARFIPTKKTLDASDCADLLINHIICHHGVPDEIVSDRDKLFTGKIWDRLRQRLRIHLKFTTSYNPASNGQTERTNDTMRKIIASYTNQHATDWPMYCSVAAFAYNNTYQSSIKTTPFFANYGFHPRLPGFTNPILDHSQNNEEQQTPGTLQSNLDYHLQALQNIMVSIQTNMADAQDHQSIHFNKRHRVTNFKVGDSVLVHKDAYNNKPYTKFHHLWYGPFKIIEKMGDQTYRLNSQLGNRRTNTFHVRRLKLYHQRQHNSNNVPPTEYKNKLHLIERVVRTFRNSTCEVQWSNAETWDTSILPLHIIFNSEYRHLLDPYYDPVTKELTVTSS